MTAAHTAGPYMAGALHGQYDGERVYLCAKFGVEVKAIAEFKKAADCEFAVRACNAHDDLLAALRELDANCENRQDEPFVAYVRKTCRAAISKAEAP